MDIEFIKNQDTGLFEAWEDGRIVGEFVPATMLTKHRKLADNAARKGRNPAIAPTIDLATHPNRTNKKLAV